MKNTDYFDLKAIMSLAKEKGVSEDALFLQTLKNYQTIQLAIAKIDEILKNDETTITKEYVKGRENIYLHPAIKELSKLSDSSNKTLTMLLTIIEKNGNDSKHDELFEFLRDHER